jgi:hypothetical protein
MNRVNLITAGVILLFFLLLRVSAARGQTRPATRPGWSEPTQAADEAGRTWWIQTAGQVDADDGPAAVLMWRGELPELPATQPTTRPANDADVARALEQAQLQAASMKLLLEIAADRTAGTSAAAAVQAAQAAAAATVNRLEALKAAIDGAAEKGP